MFKPLDRLCFRLHFRLAFLKEGVLKEGKMGRKGTSLNRHKVTGQHSSFLQRGEGFIGRRKLSRPHSTAMKEPLLLVASGVSVPGQSGPLGRIKLLRVHFLPLCRDYRLCAVSANLSSHGDTNISIEVLAMFRSDYGLDAVLNSGGFTVPNNLVAHNL